MQTTPAISVIVPCYKVEKYLRECIDSILRQTFQDFELILVDDGSPDASGKIIDEYTSRHAQVRAIHQVNGGVTAARRTGVEHARGEWVCFVDADDELPENSLQVLYDASSEKYDMVIGFHYPSTDDCELSVDELRSYAIKGGKFTPNPWGRLIRRKLFVNTSIFDIPREIVQGEDRLMNIRLSFATDKPARLIPAKVYCYRNNVSSVSQIFKYSQAYELMYDKYRTASIPKKFRSLYVNDCLTNRLDRYFSYLLTSEGWQALRNRPFIKKIRADLQVANYPLTTRQRLMLCFPVYFMAEAKFRRTVGRLLRSFRLRRVSEFK